MSDKNGGRPPPPGSGPPPAGRSRGRASDASPTAKPPGPPRPGPPSAAGQAPRVAPPSQMYRPGPPGQQPASVPGRGTPATPPAPAGAPPPGRSRGQQQPPSRPGPGPQPPGRGRGDTLTPAMAGLSISSQASEGSTVSASTRQSLQKSEPAGSAASRTQGSGTGAGAAGSGGDGSGSGRGRGAPGGEDPGRGRDWSYVLRTRPSVLVSKKGDGGSVCPTTTNYFKIDKKPGWNLLQHRVDFKPEEDETKIKKILVRGISADKLKQPYLFDGTMLFTTQRFEPPLVVTCQSESGALYEITIRFVREVSATDYNYIQLMNILLRKMMEAMKLAQVGRNYYDPAAKTIIREYKLELWPGYVTSIRQHENDLLLCAELSTKILRIDTALDQFKAASRGGGANMRSIVSRNLIGQIVITKYNNLTYRIDDIDWDNSPSKLTFEQKRGPNAGKTMTLVEYYKERYKLNIEDKGQPLLISNPDARMRRRGMTEPIKLVPELCNMTGLSDEQRADFKLMKAVSGVTLQAPPKRVQSLNAFAKRLTGTKEITDELRSWDLRFNPALVQFNGRTLNPETIIGGNNKSFGYKSPDDADWSAMFRNFTLFNPVGCQKWAVIHNERDKGEVEEFVKCLCKVSSQMAFTLAKPKFATISSQRTPDYVNMLKKILTLGPLTVMIVIPNNKTDAYAAVKKITLLENPLPTQCITATVLRKFAAKGFNSVAQKVAVQMACKLGGEPWGVVIPSNAPIMVIGYDTWHDASQKGMSIGGVVATLNPSLTRFWSNVTRHRNNEENLDQMKVLITNSLREFHRNQNRLPERVIVYRDGVGDGQIALVKEQEVTMIQAALKDVAEKANGGKLIKLTYVIVSKRINSRFFKTGRDYTNPPSGSVFDDVVTLPERYDFYLISQSVRQGTVNPTGYNIIEDNSNWPPKVVQALTYKLTHLYYNWPGTVRVPMVCQYAHKLAYLVGQSVHAKPHDNLAPLLYYL